MDTGTWTKVQNSSQSVFRISRWTTLKPFLGVEPNADNVFHSVSTVLYSCKLKSLFCFVFLFEWHVLTNWWSCAANHEDRNMCLSHTWWHFLRSHINHRSYSGLFLNVQMYGSEFLTAISVSGTGHDSSSWTMMTPLFSKKTVLL